MGAGHFPAGVGPAGFDPVEIGASTIVVPPAAAQFEMFERSVPVDTTSGQLVEVHPVDQEVAIALGIQLGTIFSAPIVGLDIARLRRTPRHAMQRAVNDVVLAALQRLISDGDILLLGSPLMPDAHGRPWFFVDYVNLRLPTSEQRRRLGVSAGRAR